MWKLFKLLRRFSKNKRGATALEYGLICSLVAVVLITSLRTLGNRLVITFDSINNQLRSVETQTGGDPNTATPTSGGGGGT
jgi:pilus assembly protein Flp/PilA